jgi:sulfur carrier protein
MEISLNGTQFSNDTLTNVASLLEIKQIKGQRVAVMINDVVIKKDKFDETPIHEGDRVEIIQMVGGG